MSESVAGVLEIVDRGRAFLRRREASYLSEESDVAVPPALIQAHALRTGDDIRGVASAGRGRDRRVALERVTALHGRPPEELRQRPEFGRLGAVHPRDQLRLECGRTVRGQPDYTNRVIDLLCPLGKGQRALIVSPAKAGKTTVLQAIAEGVARNYPAAALLILLVDERPEEVFEMESTGVGEVISSSFDHGSDRHVAVAEITLERARRRVELGQDVVLILDSITRLARAYNAAEKGSGRTLSGGLDATSLEKPKRFLGSARVVDEAQGGGSLTIIGTALVDTGSRMDQVIFEEFKGTGNSELVLSRELAERRIYPAIDIPASGTRREELLLDEPTLALAHAVRRRLAGSPPPAAMEQLLAMLRRAPTNAELAAAVS